MRTTKKGTPAGGCNHRAGAITQNVDILPVLAALNRIAFALEISCDRAKVQNEYLQRIVEDMDRNFPF